MAAYVNFRASTLCILALYFFTTCSNQIIKNNSAPNESKIEILHNVRDVSKITVYSYSKPILLKDTQEFILFFREMELSESFGGSFSQNENSILADYEESIYGPDFSELSINSKFIRICSMKGEKCRIIGRSDELIRGIFLSNQKFERKDEDSTNVKKHNISFSFLHIEYPNDQEFPGRSELILTDLKRTFKKIMPSNSQFLHFEYDFHSNMLFLTVLFDSDKNHIFETGKDRPAILRVNLAHPEIGEEIISGAELEKIQKLEKVSRVKH